MVENGLTHLHYCRKEMKVWKCFMMVEAYSKQRTPLTMPLVCSDNEANIFRYSLVMSCMLSKKYINVTYSDTQVNAENNCLILRYPR